MSGIAASVAVLLMTWEAVLITGSSGEPCPSACCQKIQTVSDRVTELEDAGPSDAPTAAPSTPGQPMVAFSAKASDNQIVNSRGLIYFGTVITNIGGGYDTDTSKFTCPVKGVYHFEVTILSERNTKIEVVLMAAGSARMSIYSGAGSTTGVYGSGSNSVLLELNAGDTVYVRQNNVGDAVRQHFSTFTGFLVG